MFLVFTSEEKYKAVKELLVNKAKAEQMAEKAKQTISCYNYKTAAERLIAGIKEFYSNGDITPYKCGVFSSVEIIENNWFN